MKDFSLKSKHFLIIGIILILLGVPVFLYGRTNINFLVNIFKGEAVYKGNTAIHNQIKINAFLIAFGSFSSLTGTAFLIGSVNVNNWE